MNDSFNGYNRLNGSDSIDDELEMDFMECTTKSCSALELYRIPLSSSTCIPTAICVSHTIFQNITRSRSQFSHCARAFNHRSCKFQQVEIYLFQRLYLFRVRAPTYANLSRHPVIKKKTNDVSANLTGGESIEYQYQWSYFATQGRLNNTIFEIYFEKRRLI